MAIKFEIELDYTIRDFAAFWYGFLRKKPGDPLPNAALSKPMLAVGRFSCWFFIVLGPLCIFNSLWQGERMYLEGEGLYLWLLNPSPSILR